MKISTFEGVDDNKLLEEDVTITTPRDIAEEVRQMQSLKLGKFVRARDKHLAEGALKQHMESFRCTGE